MKWQWDTNENAPSKSISPNCGLFWGYDAVLRLDLTTMLYRNGRDTPPFFPQWSILKNLNWKIGSPKNDVNIYFFQSERSVFFSWFFEHFFNYKFVNFLLFLCVWFRKLRSGFQFIEKSSNIFSTFTNQTLKSIVEVFWEGHKNLKKSYT